MRVNELLWQVIYGLIIICSAMIISFLFSKGLLNLYGDVIFYFGISIIVSGFFYSMKELSKQLKSKTIIVGGLIILMIGYIL